MRLSIITVVKNDKKNLLISLKSIMSQTYKDFEYIVYDGMSNDGTRGLVQKYLNKNIKYICKKDKNYYEGLNYAINKASGYYIGILNAGDQYFDCHTLKNIAKIIFLGRYDILFGNLIYINCRDQHVRYWNFPIKKLTLLSALKIASPTLFVKKKLAKLNPYNSKFSISSDTDFNLRLAQKKIKFLYYGHYLVFMRTGGLSTSYRFFLQKMIEDLSILRKYFKNTYVLIYLYKIIIKLKTFCKFVK